MENGRSPVLGSSLSDSEGSELMEGAASAVGRQQSRWYHCYLIACFTRRGL